MMKTKALILSICCILAIGFVLGATGVFKMANVSAREDVETQTLIGVLITKEYLMLSSERLDAVCVLNSFEDPETGETIPEAEYQFPGIDGIRFYSSKFNDGSERHNSLSADEGIADIHQEFNITDNGENTSLHGTVYLIPNGSPQTLYLNPVYQTSNGDVFVVSGDGNYFDLDNNPGVTWSQKIAETRTETAGDVTSSYSSEVEVTVCPMDVPTCISVLQFNEKNELLKKTDYAPDQLPEYFDALRDASYVIVETATSKGINRELFGREDAYAYAFHGKDNELCVKQEFEIRWGR